MEQKTDILILGGGIAGCIAAISLADSYQVTLLDKLSEPKDRIGESLAPAAQRILKELNLLKEFESCLGEVFHNNLGMQSYWGRDQLHLVDHLRNPDGLVKTLNRKGFEQFLRDSAEKRGVNCCWGTQLLRTEWKEDYWSITARPTIDNTVGVRFNASFVIDASGRQAHFARAIEVKRKVTDKLIACWMKVPNTYENKMSTIAADENGWWYSSVLPNNKRVIAFHTDSDLWNHTSATSEACLLESAKINDHISKFIPENTSRIEYQGIVSANSTKLEQVAGKRWAAIGDAAVSLDPLSSQGMFNAMASAMQLCYLIQQLGFTAELEKVHGHQMHQIWNHYLKERSLFYQAEARWSNSKFWQRRHRNELIQP